MADGNFLASNLKIGVDYEFTNLRVNWKNEQKSVKNEKKWGKRTKINKN
jgi:hypothetical protein